MQTLLSKSIESRFNNSECFIYPMIISRHVTYAYYSPLHATTIAIYSTVSLHIHTQYLGLLCKIEKLQFDVVVKGKGKSCAVNNQCKLGMHGLGCVFGVSHAERRFDDFLRTEFTAFTSHKY